MSAPLPIGGFKIVDWVPADPVSSEIAGSGFVEKIVDWAPGTTTVHTIDGSSFVDQIVVSTGIRGPAGVVVLESNENTPPPGTPAGIVVFQKV